MSNDGKVIAYMFCFGVWVILLICVGAIVAESLPPLIILSFFYWLWWIRTINRGALTFPFHRIWFGEVRSITPYTYYCQQCGRQAVYERERTGTVKYNMFSGKKKDERVSSYYYACPQHGRMDVFKEKEYNAFEITSVEDEIFSEKIKHADQKTK